MTGPATLGMISQPGLAPLTLTWHSASCPPVTLLTSPTLGHNMGDYKVYIGNIPDDCRERDVEKFFKGFGKIRNIVLKVSHRVIPPSQ